MGVIVNEHIKNKKYAMHRMSEEFDKNVSSVSPHTLYWWSLTLGEWPPRRRVCVPLRTEVCLLTRPSRVCVGVCVSFWSPPDSKMLLLLLQLMSVPCSTRSPNIYVELVVSWSHCGAVPLWMQDSGQSARRRPPSHYVCRKCSVAADHYLNECPTNTCHRCGGKSHIATHCPWNTYTCARCGVSGHRTKNCRAGATLFVGVYLQEHCVERQLQRTVTDQEIKQAVKHGIPEPDPHGDTRRIKRSFEGVTVITEGIRIITTWRDCSEAQALDQLKYIALPATFRANGSTP